jgi:hypothetical protein
MSLTIEESIQKSQERYRKYREESKKKSKRIRELRKIAKENKVKYFEIDFSTIDFGNKSKRIVAGVDLINHQIAFAVCSEKDKFNAGVAKNLINSRLYNRPPDPLGSALWFAGDLSSTIILEALLYIGESKFPNNHIFSTIKKEMRLREDGFNIYVEPLK